MGERAIWQISAPAPTFGGTTFAPLAAETFVSLRFLRGNGRAAPVNQAKRKSRQAWGAAGNARRRLFRQRSEKIAGGALDAYGRGEHHADQVLLRGDFRFAEDVFEVVLEGVDAAPGLGGVLGEAHAAADRDHQAFFGRA